MVYLDNAATTCLRTEVMFAMAREMQNFANPSSPYSIGREVRGKIESVRECVAESINADPSEIFFTSGGSEANSFALNGIGDKLVASSPIEHHSVMNANFANMVFSVDSFGRVVVDSIKKYLPIVNRKKYWDSILLTIMLVNNEIGTIQPIDCPLIREISNNFDFFHVDAVQAYGHIPIDMRKWDHITSLSISAHKIGGPKGVGVLYIRKDKQSEYSSIINGGQQEFGLRGGTENVLGILGFGEAVKATMSEMNEMNEKYLCFAKILREMLPKRDFILNGEEIGSKWRVNNILNFQVRGIRAEELIELLDINDVYISSGSACSSQSKDPSHVLKAIGLSDDAANSSIRVSFGWDTDESAVVEGAERILECVDFLRERGPK